MPRGIVAAVDYSVIVGSGNVQSVGGGGAAGPAHGSGVCSPRADVSDIQRCGHCQGTSIAGSASMRGLPLRGRGRVSGALSCGC